MKITYHFILFKFASILLLVGCTDFLSIKPEQSLVVPQSLEDLEALLNNQVVVNTPGLHEILSDNYYVAPDDWKFMLSVVANAPVFYEECTNHIWDPQAYHRSWSETYRYPIYQANVVLDVLDANTYGDQTRANQIKGSALYYRAYAFERLVGLYAKPYSSAGPEDLGIVLRQTSNINVKPIRATVHESYEQIIADLKNAATLLPERRPYPTHPTKAAAYGALARTYLNMRMYDLAGDYANKCLELKSDLIDYNGIDGNETPVFTEYNEEVIFHSAPIGASILAPSRARIDTVFYKSYDDYDLRKSLFFTENTNVASGSYSFRGSYLGRFNPSGSMVFDGITTAEMLLVRAECRARNSELALALEDLNLLMQHRYSDTVDRPPFYASGKTEILAKILDERRKELVFRGLRWGDLRRLNEEGANIALQREIDGVLYILPPGDKRWVMLLPPEVINHSNLTQNPR